MHIYREFGQNCAGNWEKYRPEFVLDGAAEYTDTEKKLLGIDSNYT